MRVLLADDQVWLRSALRLLLEEEADVAQIDEVSDLKSLLAHALDYLPGLILLDWELPGLKTIGAGRDLITSLRAASPHSMIVVLSGRPEAGRRALEAGADEFVSKADPPETLLAIVRRAASAVARRHPSREARSPEAQNIGNHDIHDQNTSSQGITSIDPQPPD